ncbi:MAG: hypothetical protein HY240_02175 [Actinobacteria bacterium]|nr:hypothetical protein [Actinomycetota bacterium]
MLAVVIALVAIGSMVGGGFLLLRPVPCGSSRVVSARFGYCADPPGGWESHPAVSGPDLFTASASPAVVEVSVVRVPASSTLAQIADQVATLDRGVGFQVGDPVPFRLGGRPALWFEGGASTGSDTVRLREVVVVKDGIAWRITLSDTGGSYDRDLPAFGELLSSLQFF